MFTSPRITRRHLLVASAVAAVIAGAIVFAAERDEEQPPSSAGLSPDQADGEPLEFLAHRKNASPSGLDAQLYCTAEPTPTGSPCDRYHSYVPSEDQRWTIEVTQGERSARFDVKGTPSVSDFDDDSLLVQDGTEQAVRLRLLQADGTAVNLRRLSDLAPANPGPDVILIQDLGTYRSGQVGPDGSMERPYLVDDQAGTLQLLDVPQEVEWWGSNVDEFLWGADDCRVVWQQPNGKFDHHDADCRNPSPTPPTDPGWNGDSAAWLKPGRMAIVERDADGENLVVHASLDRGATWERVEVGDTSGEVPEAISELLQLID